MLLNEQNKNSEQDKSPMMTFQDLNLSEPLLKALAATGYTQPTPIQQRAIPIVLQQKDLLGCAQTGTGKTAAFALPILHLLHHRQDPTYRGKRSIKALILTPTRELAIQIGENFETYGQFTSLRHTVIFGGVSQKKQTDALHAGVDVLIATPGRLLDLIGQGFINLKNLEILVLDEADRMLDMGFVHDVKRIMALVPARRQTLFFSATMPPEIQKLANSILFQPEKVEVAPVSSTAETITQSIYYVGKNDKKKLLLDVLKDKSIETALVFTRTKHGADIVCKVLNQAGIGAAAIHGNKSQNARQNALNNFKSKEIRVLVATDIAARGIDVDQLAFVINYEIPNIPETYVHRIGRTGRAGALGKAVSFCDEEEQVFVRDIQKVIGRSIPVVEGHAYAIPTPVFDRNFRATPKAATPQRPARREGSRPNDRSAQRDKSPRSSNSENENRSQKPKKKWFGKRRD